MYIFMATFIGLIMNSKCQQTLLKLKIIKLVGPGVIEATIANNENAVRFSILSTLVNWERQDEIIKVFNLEDLCRFFCKRLVLVHNSV